MRSRSERVLLPGAFHEDRNDDVGHRGDEGGAGDGENPGHDDALTPDPADGADGFGGADAQDRAGDGVGGGDGDLGEGGEDDGGGGGGFSAEAADGLKLGDVGAHGFDDAPSAEHG